MRSEYAHRVTVPTDGQTGKWEGWLLPANSLAFLRSGIYIYASALGAVWDYGERHARVRMGYRVGKG